ncbi:MAG: hypothetical protein PUB99_03310 [Oscillospiraceae bacterium]|nr:hypothetical protein [Oscillospiraceae bacterium]
MNKRKLSWLAVLVVILSFSMVISFSNAALVSGVDENAPMISSSTAITTATTKNAPEQPYEPPADSSTASSTTATTASTTNEPATKPSTPNILDRFTSSTSSTTQTSSTSTTKADNSEQHENPSEQGSTGSTTGTGSTTKKTTTTTKKNIYNKTTVPAATVPKMTVPHVDNTEIEGTVLDPLDAYFERLSGDTGIMTDAQTVSETTQPEQQEDGAGLSTAAILAICLGGIAVLTCAITGVLAVRNKKQGGSGHVEYDDEYEDYEAEAPEDPESFAADANVDQTDGFTVVSLDDTDYKD